VGPDFTIISIGRLDGSGQATATVSPPFLGTTLDRYYVQAVVSPSASFIPLQAGPVRILKNADLVAGLAGLSRVASVEHSADVRLPNVGPVVVAQITVLAPRSGSVLLNASGSFEMLELGAGTAATCSLTTGETVERPYSAYAKESPFSNTYQYVPFGGTRIFGVTAGTSTTFRLVCAGFGVTVVSPVLTALFVAGS
jgi:hypothetical protein